MALFGLLGKKQNKVAHEVFCFKKNGKNYLVVADNLEEAVRVVQELYSNYNLTANDLKEESDKDLYAFYGNEAKSVYEITR